MINSWGAILRGRAARSEAELAARHALLILDGQIRDGTRAAEACRRALAIAAAQDDAEGRRLDALEGRIADLEARAVAALRDGADDLAGRAAEAIAALEDERAAAGRDRAALAAEHDRLKRDAAEAARRLAALERGRRTAEAADALRRLRTGAPPDVTGPGPIAAAEATLSGLRAAQARATDVERHLDAMRPEGAAEGARAALESAGYGPRSRTAATDVLERLRRASRDAA